MPYPNEISRAEREGMPTTRLICNGCGEETSAVKLTPHGFILCPVCREIFFDEDVAAVLGALSGDKLFGFIDEDAVKDFLKKQLNKLVEVG